MYTWKDPEDNPIHTVRNHIDHIVINNRFTNSINRFTTYPRSDIGSADDPLIADAKVKLKQIMKKHKQKNPAFQT